MPVSDTLVNKPVASPSEKKDHFLPFGAIVSLAEKKAADVIGKNNTGSYIIDTPNIEYIPQNIESGKDSSLELIPVYIFPLKKDDTKGVVIQEIVIPANGE